MQTVTTTTNIPQSIASTVTCLDPKEARRREVEFGRAERWLEERVQRGAQEAFSEIATISPILAEIILRKNPHNRAIRPNRLEEIKADLVAHDWTFNGESIVISDKGTLNDGQHRLMACRDTGRAIETAIVFGVRESARLTVDTGTVRTMANFLEMSGQRKDAGLAAAIARYIFIFFKHSTVESRTVKHKDRPTKTSLRRTEAEWREKIHVSLERTKNVKMVKMLGPRSLIAFTHLLLAEKDQEAADIFIGRLIDGANISEGSPVYVLRQRLINDVKMAPQHRFEGIIRAWNATRRGESLARIFINGKAVKVAA